MTEDERIAALRAALVTINEGSFDRFAKEIAREAIAADEEVAAAEPDDLPREDER